MSRASTTTSGKKTRAAQIRRQPFCSHCGLGRAESRFLIAQGGSRQKFGLTADKIISQAEGGDPFDPANLQTLCGSCNSAKAHLSMRISDFDKARKWKRAGGGLVERLLQGTLDESGAIRPGMETRSQQLNQMLEQKRGGWAKGVYLTGERGVEWYKSKSGKYDRPVGLRGPEIFTPPEDGEIIPNHKLPRRADGGTADAYPNIHYGRNAGKFQSGPQAAAAAFASGKASSIQIVGRVVVANWPAWMLNPQVGQGFQQFGQAAAHGNIRAPRAG